MPRDSRLGAQLFALARRTAEPFLPQLYRVVHMRLLDLAKRNPGRLEALDVGGRKSHYTVGVPMWITISDLPRRNEVQQRLHLGMTNSLFLQVQRRRSNVRRVVFDDMTRSSLRSGSFDFVVAVEVLEHVEMDADFVREACRVLKPGGYFLMTTPNGESVVNTNPDHRRHYTRAQLSSLLSASFDQVEVEYAVVGGMFYQWGLRSWSPRRPVVTLKSVAGNLVNLLQSNRPGVRTDFSRTMHLIAVARKTG